MTGSCIVVLGDGRLLRAMCCVCDDDSLYVAARDGGFLVKGLAEYILTRRGLSGGGYS